MSAPLRGTEFAANAIQRVSYSHDAMIDLILVQPGISQNEIAKHFGYTVSWVSQVFNSDAFQARLAERKADLVDPVILATIEEKMKGVAAQSLDIIARKLEATQSPDMALKALELTSKALGYGANTSRGGSTQVNFVVALPGKAQSAAEWAEAHAPGGKIIGADAS